MYKHLKNKYVTTTKRHTCEWCGEAIVQGSKARYIVGIDIDYTFQSFYLHWECHESAKRVLTDCGEVEYNRDRVRGETVLSAS